MAPDVSFPDVGISLEKYRENLTGEEAEAAANTHKWSHFRYGGFGIYVDERAAEIQQIPDRFLHNSCVSSILSVKNFNVYRNCTTKNGAVHVAVYFAAII